MTKCYLRYQGDFLSDAELMPSINEAKATFERTARELDRYGQKIKATLHLYDHGVHDAPHCLEYPDYVLSLSKNLNVICAGS